MLKPGFILSLLFAGIIGGYFIDSSRAAQLVPTTALPVSKSLVFASTSIAISTTTSVAIPTKGLSLVGIQMPAAFTGTAITFTGSVDCTTYQAVYSTTSGTALSYTVAQGHYVAIDPTPFYGLNCLKIVSGSTEVAARAFTVSLKGI
jgi:hypothetical protein